MSKSRTSRKLLSLLLIVCMVVCFMPAMSITVGAAENDSWVGDESFDYTADTAGGDGWTWDGGTKTLTLSGVNASKADADAIHIAAPSGDTVFLVLEGANTATGATGKNGLYCQGTLTIEGSGTLETIGTGTGSYGIYAGNLIINSGCITATGVNGGLSGTNFTINGGYVSATVTGNDGDWIGALCPTTYTQNGGYVKAVSGTTNGLMSNTFTMNGGYLETTGVTGIKCTSFTNENGVVKTTGTTFGIDVNSADFNGGVTIVKGATKTIDATRVYGTELYWTTTDGTVSGEGKALNDTPTLPYSPDVKYAVIAKAAQSTQYTGNTADGVYVKASDVAWEPSDDATVTGGSYFEGTQNGLYSDADARRNVSVTGTLVCVATGTEGEGFNTYGNVTMGTDATLYGEYTGIAEKAGITADGGIVGTAGATGYDVIGVTLGTGHAVWAPLGTSATPITGNVVALNKNTGSGAAIGKNIYIGDGGYVTGVAEGVNSTAISVPTNNIATTTVSVTDTGAMTAVGNTKAFSGQEITGAVTGATAANSPLTEATFKSPTYEVGNPAATATVLLVKPVAAVISGDDILGYIGQELTAELSVKLAGLTFNTISADTDVSDWFKINDEPLPAGITAKIKTGASVSQGSNTATVTLAVERTVLDSEDTGTITGGTIAKSVFVGNPTDVIPTGSIPYTIEISPTRTIALDCRAPNSLTMTDGTTPVTAITIDGDTVYAVETEGWSWNETDKILTLNGLRLETSAAIALEVPDNTTIVVTGENSVKSTMATSGISSGMFLYGDDNTNTTFTGSGNLTATGGNTASNYSSWGIKSTAGVSVTFSGTGTIKGVGGNSGSNSYGIDVVDMIIVESGTVEGVGGTSGGNGWSTGVYAPITVNNGTLKGFAGTSNIKSYGIRGNSTVTVNAGTVIADGDTSGISSINMLTINGGIITASSASMAFGDEPNFATTFNHTVTAGSNVDGSGATNVANPTAATFTGSKYVRIAPRVISSGGGSAITVPASSDEGSANVKATVSGDKATITITDTQLDKIIGDKKNTGTVKVDASSLKVDEAVIPAKLVNAAANATGSKGLELELATGTVTLDTKALKDIGEENITISVEDVKISELTAVQKEALGEDADRAVVVDINVFVNGVKKSDFNGGVITVGIPYTPKTREDTSKLAVWYISDNGTMEKMKGHYDAKAKMYIFDTTHLSKYVLVSGAAEVVNPFIDIANTAYYYDAVMWAVDKGVTQGTTATTFSPNTICTRAQMVTFLWRAMGSPEPTITANPFADVKANAYYYKAVMWAAEKGITEGTSATTFSPNDTVTRGQVVTLEWRTAGKPAATVANPFTDVASGAYYENAVMWAVDKKITEGTSSTTFSPADGCTRAQIVTFLFRYLDK